MLDRAMLRITNREFALVGARADGVCPLVLITSQGFSRARMAAEIFFLKAARRHFPNVQNHFLISGNANV